MLVPAEPLTVFALLMPAWKLEMSWPVMLVAASVCVGAWILIGADLRRSG
jgi:hypothetical protein